LVLVGPLADSNAVYYYHYDALGSVVALSDAGGDTVQTYEYSVYGQVAAEDPNHPNPYMFTGRRFDIEIGLYYYRARYYDPYTGRFLQTDPIGYGDGINWYSYCGNNPLGRIDPSGLAWVAGDWADPYAVFEVKIAFYDGGDQTNGAVFLECADDDNYFDIAIDIRLGEQYGYDDSWSGGTFGYFTDFIIRLLGHPEDLGLDATDYQAYLEANPGDYSKFKITDVYIFDHGNKQGDAIEIGDRWLRSGSTNLAAFCTGMGQALTNPDATIHFRNCNVANKNARGQRPFLTELATLTGHNVTGVEGSPYMLTLDVPFTNIIIATIPRSGPDYSFPGLYQATPDGTVTTLWKREITARMNSFGIPIPVNPWGPQPY